MNTLDALKRFPGSKISSEWLNKRIWAFMLLVAIAGLSSCASVKMPDEVAHHFWKAMKEKDGEKARRYATEETRELINLSDFRWRDANVTFDEIRIKGDHATIETKIEQVEKYNKTPASFQTVLKRQNGIWGVDYKETMRSVSGKNGFSEIMRDLHAFKRDLTENLDDALSNLEREAPKLEKEMQSLGNTIKKSVEEFARELDKLFKDSQKSRKRNTEEDRSI